MPTPELHEGTCYQFKNIILAVEEDVLNQVFTEKELLKLRDKKRDPKTGELKMFYLPTRDLVKFVFDSFAKLFVPEFKLELGKGYQYFLDNIKIRNRITHPKHHIGFFVTAEELKQVRYAGDWFAEEYTQLVNAFIKSPYLGEQDNTT